MGAVDLDRLISSVEADYGSEWKNHALEQYKIAVEMADRTSQRRNVMHGFFLSGNSILLTVTAVGLPVLSDGGSFVVFSVGFVCIIGILLCYYWRKLVVHYCQLNSGKYSVIQKMEKLLPLAPYDAEWMVLGEGKDPNRYTPLTRTEAKLPLVFAGLYVVLAVATVIVTAMR